MKCKEKCALRKKVKQPSTSTASYSVVASHTSPPLLLYDTYSLLDVVKTREMGLLKQKKIFCAGIPSELNQGKIINVFKHIFYF